MILIVGATGLLGSAVAKQLVIKGEQVRALVRTSGKAQDLKYSGVEVIEGDLTDHNSLAAACQGSDRVVAAAHAMMGRGRNGSENVDDAGHRALIDAAKAAGVSHFVYMSILSAAPDHPVDFFRTKYRIEEYLKKSGMHYTILRPTAFMEWHAHMFNGKSILERGNTALLGRGTKPRNFVAVKDVAQFAVLGLTNPAFANRTVEIGGPGNYSNNEVARLYAELAGVRPRIFHVPVAIVRFMSLMLRPFHPGIGRIMRMNSLPDDAFDETFDSIPQQREFSVHQTTLEEFIRERIAESKKGA